MKLKNYIFISTEGSTFQPDSDSSEPDIENAQVIGFISGISYEDAFSNLLKNNPYLLDTTFDELICYELATNYSREARSFHLKESRRS